MATAEHDPEELVRRMVEEQADGNIEALDEILAPDFVLHNPYFDQVDLNREEYKELNRDNQEKHDDWTQTVKVISVNDEEDEVVERTQLSGTLTEEEAAENPWRDKREFTVDMNRHHRIEDGRIAETWEIHVPADKAGE